jgi:hypothetical protein
MGHFCERQGQELVPARKTPDASVVVIAFHTMVKFAGGNKFNDLSEDSAATVHTPLWTWGNTRFRVAGVQIPESQDYP